MAMTTHVICVAKSRHFRSDQLRSAILYYLRGLSGHNTRIEADPEIVLGNVILKLNDTRYVAELTGDGTDDCEGHEVSREDGLVANSSRLEVERALNKFATDGTVKKLTIQLDYISDGRVCELTLLKKGTGYQCCVAYAVVESEVAEVVEEAQPV